MHQNDWSKRNSGQTAQKGYDKTRKETNDIKHIWLTE